MAGAALGIDGDHHKPCCQHVFRAERAGDGDGHGAVPDLKHVGGKTEQAAHGHRAGKIHPLHRRHDHRAPGCGVGRGKGCTGQKPQRVATKQGSVVIGLIRQDQFRGGD